MFYIMYGRQVSGAYVWLTKPTTSETITLFSTIEAEPGRIYPSQRERDMTRKSMGNH
jgi:hypothetical protein